MFVPLIDRYKEYSPSLWQEALFGILFETNIMVARGIYTLLALCFHPQPRGGPELLGAPLLGVIEQSQSKLEKGSEQGGGSVRVPPSKGCRKSHVAGATEQDSSGAMVDTDSSYSARFGAGQSKVWRRTEQGSAQDRARFGAGQSKVRRRT